MVDEYGPWGMGGGGGGCRFYILLRQTFFPAIFSPHASDACEKSRLVSGFGKKSCARTGFRNPGNT